MSDKYYHEAGHTLISKIFPEAFHFEFVTIDTNTARAIDKRSSGGVNGKAIWSNTKNKIFAADKLVIMTLAGMCTDALVDSGWIPPQHLSSPENLYRQLHHPNYEGDYNRFMPLFKEKISSWKYILSYKKYFEGSFEFLFRILVQPEIRQALEKIRQGLIETNILFSDDVDDILNVTNFPDWLERNIEGLKAERILFLTKASGNVNFWRKTKIRIKSLYTGKQVFYYDDHIPIR